MRSWLENVWVIFLVTLAYSVLAFTIVWRYGPVQLIPTVLSELIVPIIYGIAWFAYRSRNFSFGVAAFLGCAAWVAALLVTTLAHYPPFLDLLDDRIVAWRRSALAEPLLLVAPILLAALVSARQSIDAVRQLRAGESGRNNRTT
jgi:ABC-type branched-subunit amino acid transport system permease subunit